MFFPVLDQIMLTPKFIKLKTSIYMAYVVYRMVRAAATRLLTACVILSLLATTPALAHHDPAVYTDTTVESSPSAEKPEWIGLVIACVATFGSLVAIILLVIIIRRDIGTGSPRYGRGAGTGRWD